MSTYVCGADANDNVIENVRADHNDRLVAETLDSEVKVFLLGNGAVGKTQLRRRLKGELFDASQPTTHGIVVDDFTVTLDGQNVRLNLWDFGGQDIYHGSHTLFLRENAVFVLLWTRDHECSPYVQGTDATRHRPLSYWLDYIHAFVGTECPILVVQSQCDYAEQQRTPPLPIHDFRLYRTLSCTRVHRPRPNGTQRPPRIGSPRSARPQAAHSHRPRKDRSPRPIA